MTLAIIHRSIVAENWCPTLMFQIPDDNDTLGRLRDQVQLIPANQAITWHAEGSVFVIDVRELFEFNQEHIPDAYSMPLSGFDPRFLPNLGGRRMLLHCAVGLRCAYAAKTLIQFGHSDPTFRLKGGLRAWVAAGGPVLRPPPA